MKRNIILCILAVLCALLCVCVASCGDEEEGTGVTETTGTTSSSSDSSKPHKHIFSAWMLATAEGCLTDGEAYRRCPCGKLETKKLPATGHTFVDGECKRCRTEVSWSEGIQYNLSPNGEYYIAANIGTCTDKTVYIRKEYEGKPVREIGDGAFRGCSFIEEIVLCNGIEKINEDAFGGCTALKVVSLPESMKEIKEFAFLACTGITRVALGGTEIIGQSAFRGCMGLEEITIGDTVLTIGKEAFEGCGDLKISCEVASKPVGWDEDWAGDCKNVEWKAN